MNSEKLADAVAHAARQLHLPDRWIVGTETRRLQVPRDVRDSLVEIIRAEANLNVFDRRTLDFMGKGGPFITLADLAEWLVNRTWQLFEDGFSSNDFSPWLKKGISSSAWSAVADLERYLSATEIPTYVVATIAGVDVSGRFRLSKNIELLPLKDVPRSDAKLFFARTTEYFNPLTISPSSSAFIRPLVRSKASTDIAPSYLEIGDELSNICRLMSLAEMCAPELTALWEQTEDWVPCGNDLGIAWNLPARGSTLRPIPDFGEKECERIRCIYEHYLSLSEETRKTLKTSLERLSAAIGGEKWVDQAIDLGISLETLFLHDRKSDRGDSTLNLRLRAARYLRSGVAERKALAALISAVYNLRSEGVHTGAINLLKKRTDRLPTEIIYEGCVIMAEALRKIIAQEGCIPDWDKIVYG